MEFPVYKEKDLISDERDGDFYNSDFAKLIQELVERNEIENDIEKGIAAKVLAEGTFDLTEKQAYHLQKIFNRYNNIRCIICNEVFPLSEVLYLDGNLCSYHQNQSEKDKD